MSVDRHLLPRRSPAKIFLKAQWISEVKRNFCRIYIATMPAVEVPFQVQPLYRRISEALYLRAMKADEKLQIMFSIVQQEDVIRRLIELICLIQDQLSLIVCCDPPRYILTFEALRNIDREFTGIILDFKARLEAYRAAVALQKAQSGLLHIPPPKEPQQQKQLPEQLLKMVPLSSIALPGHFMQPITLPPPPPMGSAPQHLVQSHAPLLAVTRNGSGNERDTKPTWDASRWNPSHIHPSDAILPKLEAK